MRERPLSSSSIKTFLQCSLKYCYQYEDKKVKPEGGPHLAFGTALHAALEELHKVVTETRESPDDAVYQRVIDTFMKSAVKGGLSDLAMFSEAKNILTSRLDSADPQEKILGLELRFELKTPNGTPFTGSIDKLLELDENTVAIIDYKSSRMALTQEEADSDIQLSMYDLAVSMLYPQYTTIIGAFDYLRLGDVMTSRTLEQRALFVNFLDKVYESILEMDATQAKPNVNTFCGWCEFKSYCPSYSKLVNDPASILPRLDEMSDAEFVDAWVNFAGAKKAVEAWDNELKDQAYQRLSDSDTVKGKEIEIYKIQTGRKSYDSKAIFNIVGPQKYLSLSSVVKDRVEKHMRDNPEDSDLIEDGAISSFNNPSFRTRKLKKD